MTYDHHPTDDGRTIADMGDVRRGMPGLLSRRGHDAEVRPSRDFADELQDGEERTMVILGVLKAALSIGAVYVVGFGLAIAFLLWLWT